MSALTNDEIRANEKKAEEIKSKPWFTAESMNDRPFGSVIRKELEDRIKGN